MSLGACVRLCIGVAVCEQYNLLMQYIDTAPTSLLSGMDYLHPDRFTRDRVRDWLAASEAVAANGDTRFADDGETLQIVARDKPLKPAAVLVLVVKHPVPTIVFTQRTAHLTDHAGQISFPGGRVEESDASAAATAVREAVEETGLDASAIEVLGELPHYTTGTNYLIRPIVAWAESALSFRPDPSEVEEVFEVPAPFLLDANNHRREEAMYKGRMREYYAIPFEQRYIWGATAGMLITFSRVVAHAEGVTLAPAIAMAPDSA
jgi:8-oxo-dGTP pyrophosphatase MutT (NUDIX family)